MSKDVQASKAHKERNYFVMFENLLKYSKQAADYVSAEFNNFNPDEATLDKKLIEIHAIEHAADSEKHELMEKLVKEFITPIEREDIIDIANAIDEVTDNIEELYQKIYMYNIDVMIPEALAFTEIVNQCVEKLQKIYKEFHNYKKSSTIYDYIIELNRLEEDGDQLYIKVIRKIYGSVEEPVKAVAWTRIFDQMERCCDSCETAGNLVAEVIMKNS